MLIGPDGAWISLPYIVEGDWVKNPKGNPALGDGMYPVMGAVTIGP
ncbi:MAG: hypothetical protein ACE5PO_04870 [Candidatus Bathyarchaeia archaeon]